MQRLSCLFYGFLKIAANAQRLGLGMIRVAILIIFVWIGGLKFWNYEAEGIVPFVANSPFMSFFYNEKAPEYRDYKLKEGEYDAEKYAVCRRSAFYRYLGRQPSGDPDCSGKAHQPKRRDSDRIKTLSGKTGFILLQEKP